MNVFEFILFAILGWAAFANPQTQPTRTVLLVVYVVLMVLWLVSGYAGWHLNFPTR